MIIMNIVNIYNTEIYTLYKDLKSKNYQNDYHKIYKIFEYYSCILLTNENNINFYEYNDIPTDFKITNNLSILDTGIDCCDLNDTIVQCKLRSNNLTWTDCSSFIASKTSFNKETNQEYIRWLKCVITRNSDCKLSKNLTDHNFRFIDKPYDMNNFYEYCENLLLNPPITKQININNKDFKLRDYQIEAINLIKNQDNQNVIINLPTGSGKNVIIINSIDSTKKYLILVPRIVLLYQLKEEFKKFGFLTYQIQCIGDNNKKFDINKEITICVYNSIDLIEDVNIFDKIYIDEAHHIYYPDIYKEFDDEYISDTESTDYDSENESSETESKASLEFNLSYIDKIKSMHKLNKIIYLSATIDPLENDIYYQKSINYMIDNKYLSDYQIIVPVFNQDPSNSNIANYLINNYSNIIIYCKTQAEGLEFNNLLNSIVSDSSEYIDCNTSKINRNIIINKFKEGNLRFLVNVRILTEGFDAPKTKGIMFLHLPSTRNTIIQCIGRSLRLDDNKLNAKIILPYSTSEDNDNITNFINILSQYDEKIKKGRLSIRNESKYNNVKKENLNNYEDVELITEQIYKKINLDRNSNWFSMLEKLEQFIKINNKIPKDTYKNKEEKQLCSWMYNQKNNYKKKINIMKNKEIRIVWNDFINKYTELFKDNLKKWYVYLNKLEQYIKDEHKIPNKRSKNNEEKKLGAWLGTNKGNYKNEIYRLQYPERINIWSNFITKYAKLFKDSEEVWSKHFNKLEQFIKDNNKTPSYSSKNNEEKKLGAWLTDQKSNYKKESYILQYPERINIWSDLVKKYNELFKDNDEIWYINLNKLEQFIKDNHKKPSSKSKYNDEKFIGEWVNSQHKNYKKKINIMKNKEIRIVWNDFINKYTKLFKDNNEIWYDYFNKLEQFIKNNHNRPNSKSKNNEVKKLGTWLITQKRNYKNESFIMQDVEIRIIWNDFINTYSEFFKDTNEVWYDNLNKLEQFIKDNNKTPLDKSKDIKDKYIGSWLSVQKKNYKNKINIMKNEEIRIIWKEFIIKYYELFMTNDEIWHIKLNKLEQFINYNKKSPSDSSKNNEEKQLGSWLSNQKHKYNKVTGIMKNKDIRKIWNDFIIKYNEFIINRF